MPGEHYAIRYPSRATVEQATLGDDVTLSFYGGGDKMTVVLRRRQALELWQGAPTASDAERALAAYIDGSGTLDEFEAALDREIAKKEATG